MKQIAAVLIMFGLVQLAVANNFEPQDEFSKPPAELIEGEPGGAMADLIPKLKAEMAAVHDIIHKMQALEKQGADDPSASIVGRNLQYRGGDMEGGMPQEFRAPAGNYGGALRGGSRDALFNRHMEQLKALEKLLQEHEESDDTMFSEEQLANKQLNSMRDGFSDRRKEKLERRVAAIKALQKRIQEHEERRMAQTPNERLEQLESMLEKTINPAAEEGPPASGCMAAASLPAAP